METYMWGGARPSRDLSRFVLPASLAPTPTSREGHDRSAGHTLVTKECYQLHWMSEQDTTSEPHPPPSSLLLPWGWDRAATILQGPLDPEPPSRTDAAWQ